MRHKLKASSRFTLLLFLSTPVVILLLCSCSQESEERTLVVTATAYTMRPQETKPDHIGLAAWGDQLKPGMQVIAVSRDLIGKGLDHMTKVRIEGLDGVYTVRDKMSRRWEKRIDIFMGKNVEAAREWGKQKVTIHWSNPPEE